MAAELYRKCPQCAEDVKVEAVKCKYCGSKIEALSEDERKCSKPEGRAENHLPYPFVFLVLFLCGVWVYFQANDAPALSSASQSNQSQPTSTGKYYMSSLGLGCANENLYERAFSMMTNEEWELVAELVV